MNNCLNKNTKKLLNINSIDLNLENYYKITRLSIDSRYRNINPVNIIDKYIYLEKDPFLFKDNSYILKIKIPKNIQLSSQNNITINNVKPITFNIPHNSLIIQINKSLIKINHNNHKFYGSKNIIQIQNIKSNNNFLNNIPITLINSFHKVILDINNNIINPNSYFIDVGIIAQDNYIYNNNFTINIITLAGINIKYLNAFYPITNNNLQGFFKIIDTSSDLNNNYINVELLDYATTNLDEWIGGLDINIGVIQNMINGHPSPSSYVYQFKNQFTKLKKIRLISTEIPNTQLLITNNPNYINNKLYWQILDDGDTIYNIIIDNGNYNFNDLNIIITNKINNTSRIFSSLIDNNNVNYQLYSNCIANITLNYNNFSLQILGKIFCKNAIFLDTNSNQDNLTRIIINHPFHNLAVGQKITINNATNVYNIPDNIINDSHIIEEILSINTYKIKLSFYNENNNTTNLYGGNAIEITYPLKIKLLFNYSDTIGKILGFNNVGNEDSITNFNYIINNNDIYYNSSNFNSIGQNNYSLLTTNLASIPYILMVSEIFNGNINIKDSIGIFAKLFLSSDVGTYVYNDFIQINQNVPLSHSNLSEFPVKFLTPDGNLFDFNNYEHSYTLEFLEEIN